MAKVTLVIRGFPQMAQEDLFYLLLLASVMMETTKVAAVH